MLRLRAAAEPDGDGVPGVLTLNREGQVVQHTPAAERWLRKVEDLGPDWREGDGLPAAVWMVVGALKRSLGPENYREKAGVPRLRIRARSGHWLTLYGSLSEPVPGRLRPLWRKPLRDETSELGLQDVCLSDAQMFEQPRQLLCPAAQACSPRASKVM
ncbi:hypothetical protein [Rubrobacter naiadicus]|uniref:hypothetical protein n=1 Tax=Rubrobacter naiadicus TaxID=1392641 RepID=UPI00235DF8D4|nr:hypothetical protein [Rubrobacter naiadicus]